MSTPILKERFDPIKEMIDVWMPGPPRPMILIPPPLWPGNYH